MVVTPPRRSYLVAACGLLLAFLLQCLVFINANGQTYDEGVNLAAGLRLLDTGRDDVNLEHPPLGKLIVAWPVRAFVGPRLDMAAWTARRESGFGLGRDLLYNSGVPHDRLLWFGRIPVVGMSLLLLVVIGLFAWRMWGPAAALLALALAAFDPSLIAHGSLIGMDMTLTVWVTAGAFCVSEMIRTRHTGWLVMAGVFAGLAAASKHSGPVFAAMMCGSLVVHALITGKLAPWWAPRRESTTRTSALLYAAGQALLLAGVALVVLRLSLGVAGWEPYFVGLRAQLAHQNIGHPAFFLGEISQTGWVSYFPVALAMKLPPATLLCALVSLLAIRKGASWRPAIAVVLVPFACVLTSLLFARVNIGVRYALPLWPLVILMASRVATLPIPASGVYRTLLAIVLLQHPVAAMRVAPSYLAYFSDLVGGPARGPSYLGDSNLDWGQDVSTLGRWLAARERPRRLYLSYFGTADPKAYGVSYYPAPNSCPHPAPWRREPEPSSGRELLAVSAMNMQGAYFGDRSAYAWLATRQPVAVLGQSISIYDITDDPGAHDALAALYERFGPGELAAEERARALHLRVGMP